MNFGVPTPPTHFGNADDCPLTQPLCSGLYTRLQALARERSDGRVIITNDGEPMTGDWMPDTQTGAPRWTVLTWGETYRINCPYCHDSKHRLWIPYMFGQPDPNNPHRMSDFYGICFNEDCLRKDPDNRADLVRCLFGIRASQVHGLKYEPDQVDPSRPPTIAQLVPRGWPGTCQPLSELLPTNPAVEYLAERRFDMEHFDTYDLRLCVDCNDSKHTMAIGRIIAPIVQDDVMYGWQGRFIGDSPNKRIPKYYTCPSMPKRCLLYNYDRAKAKDFIVVFEGITDVWRLGDHGVALLGKTISPQQQQMLTARENPVVVCLDADAWDSSAHTLYTMATGRSPVVRIRLPEGWDPADYETDALWNIIHTQANAAGVRLTTAGPS